MVGRRPGRPASPQKITERHRELRIKPAFYRLRDEPHATILVAGSKCDWRAAFNRDDLLPRTALTIC